MKRYEDIDSVRLFELWRSGDRAAGEALVRRHQGSVEGFLRARTASAAEELTQQTMWALLQGGYRGQASVRTFLFAVARNKLRYYIHTQGVSRGRVAASEEVIEDRDPTVSQLLLGQERRERLLVGLRSLRPDFQLALALHYWEGMSTADIAARLGVPVGTIRVHMHRGRRALEAILSESGVGRCGEAPESFGDWIADMRTVLAERERGGS